MMKTPLEYAQDWFNFRCDGPGRYCRHAVRNVESMAEEINVAIMAERFRCCRAIRAMADAMEKILLSQFLDNPIGVWEETCESVATRILSGNEEEFEK